ncbi:nuclear transport factor 2 family protein [Pectobacterium brasiliense]|uniref:nuclear transport factor 2 family protein n=1 Tax=Pectobacterium brasiliense TaxID=180957 RepID=UPI001968BB6B|nr:nuclear transport factor 2 family protein [Pectobacterium brasiliense]MBN3264140.1 nuclear transport factor 2 family protein [Pectobacterium brasiliense]
MSNAEQNNQHNIQQASPNAAAQSGLQEWHRIVAESDWERLPDLLAEDVVFSNPSTLDPYHGKGPLMVILPAVFSVLENFQYERHFSSKSGYVLEFKASMGNEFLIGVDLIEFNDEGKITDLVVMMRPANVVVDLSAEVGKRIAAAQS